MPGAVRMASMGRPRGARTVVVFAVQVPPGVRVSFMARTSNPASVRDVLDSSRRLP